MKKLAISLLAALSLTATAQAGELNVSHLLGCGIWLIPNKTCTLEQRVVGGVVVGAAVGATVGAAGAATGAIIYPASIAKTAGAGALIGAGSGVVGPLVIRW